MARKSNGAEGGTVERKIYFYRVDAGLDEAGRPLPFDPEPVLQHIEGLPFTEGGRYLEGADGNALGCWVDQDLPRQKVRLANIRRSGLPHLEQAGSLSLLPIPAKSGLVEQIHVVFFSDNIVGSEFNFFGPRLSRLKHYLAEKAGSVCPPLTFEPLLRQDVADQLARLKDVRLLRLKIRASYAATVAEADRDLGGAFEAAAKAGGAEILELTLRPAPYSRGRLAEGLLSAIRHLGARRDIRDEVSCFTLRGLDGETDRVEVVDVLSDQLIARKRIVRDEICSAHAAIEEAYSEMRDQLVAAAGVRS